MVRSPFHFHWARSAPQHERLTDWPASAATGSLNNIAATTCAVPCSNCGVFAKFLPCSRYCAARWHLTSPEGPDCLKARCDRPLHYLIQIVGFRKNMTMGGKLYSSGLNSYLVGDAQVFLLTPGHDKTDGPDSRPRQLVTTSFSNHSLGIHPSLPLLDIHLLFIWRSSVIHLPAAVLLRIFLHPVTGAAVHLTWQTRRSAATACPEQREGMSRGWNSSCPQGRR